MKEIRLHGRVRGAETRQYCCFKCFSHRFNYSPPAAETVGIVDATSIALQEMNVPITNTTMVGAFAATTGWLSLPSILESLEEFFKGELLKKNCRYVERGYQKVKIKEIQSSVPYDRR